MGPIDKNIDTMLSGLFENDKLDLDAKKMIIKELLKIMLDLYENPMSRKCVNSYIENQVLSKVRK